MKSMRRIAEIAAAFGALCLIAATPMPSAKSKEPIAAAAMSGRVLTDTELLGIFSDRTWYWKDGAAYFQQNRRFKAWVNAGAETTYGAGSWSVSNNGQLCIRATWYSLSGNTKTFTCYDHRIGSAIYQRELPRGHWYLFSHIPPRAGDEIKKLAKGDHVSAEYLRARRYVIKNRKARQQDSSKPRSNRSN